MGLHDFSQRETIPQYLTPDERKVRQAAFHLILARIPVSVPNLAERTALVPASIVEAIARLAALGLLECSQEGEVVGSWGLTQTATPFKLRIADEEFHTWCAEDAIGIPTALGVDAMVESHCFQCGQPIIVGIDRGAIAQDAPAGVHLWLAEAQYGRSMVGGT